jgi:hypothetical protein
LHSLHIKFKQLGLPPVSLGVQFTEEEVWSVIKGMEPDMAPDLEMP